MAGLTGDNTYFYEPAKGTDLPHSPIKAMIGPRPIGWISSRSADGTLNLAPYSFFSLLCEQPPIIGFASNSPKDTLANARATGQFCWNLVSGKLAEAMNETSADVDESVDEFELAGLTPARSRVVDVPHVAQARAAFECRVTQIVRLKDAAGSDTASHMVLGEVVGVHIDRGLLVDGVFDTALADPVLRAGGPSTYFALDAAWRFEMRRPGM
ncbi:MAG: flavin reductase family protein [Actinomycetaceae bacterium]|nr:flavin reductase family protein [Actinomycetaceae bacterium]